MAPFLIMGLFSIMISVMLIFVIPSNLQNDIKCKMESETDGLLSGKNNNESSSKCEGNGEIG